MSGAAPVEVRGLRVGHGGRAVQSDVSFEVRPGAIFVVMGDSGSGKTTLLRCLVGLEPPLAGEVLYSGEAFWPAADAARERLQRRFGVLFQHSALWSSMTLEENVRLPLVEQGGLAAAEAARVARLKLALVGLAGFEGHLPSQVSGGMRKRASLARAIALDPGILFCDEPSAGLDPLTARRLDELILELRDSLGATVVIVTHELATILELGDDSVFLDAERGRVAGRGRPRDLVRDGEPRVRAFLTRGRS
jgi:phospholipid/cholesterol/gamma-HCH transport system ATP-binding protein